MSSVDTNGQSSGVMERVDCWSSARRVEANGHSGGVIKDPCGGDLGDCWGVVGMGAGTVAGIGVVGCMSAGTGSGTCTFGGLPYTTVGSRLNWLKRADGRTLLLDEFSGSKKASNRFTGNRPLSSARCEGDALFVAPSAGMLAMNEVISSGVA